MGATFGSGAVTLCRQTEREGTGVSTGAPAQGCRTLTSHHLHQYSNTGYSWRSLGRIGTNNVVSMKYPLNSDEENEAVS